MTGEECYRTGWATFGAQVVNQVGNVDFHRTGSTAQAVSCTGLGAVVFEKLFEPFKAFGILARMTETRYLALHNNTLARRQRKAAAHAVYFAESAFDAFVDVVVDKRHRLEVLNEAFGVVIEDDTGIEYAFGIKQILDFAHDAVGSFAPFVFDKGSHVASGAVFGF